MNIVSGRGERGGGTQGLIAISTVGKIGDQSKARNLLVCKVQRQRCVLCLGGAGDAIFLYDDYSSSGNILSVSGES